MAINTQNTERLSVSLWFYKSMGELIKLSNQIQNYAWGSHTTLASMRGLSVPSQKPEAEVWVGAHPSAPSTVHASSGDIALDRLVAESPERVLPAGLTSFPFLFKILAIDAPLSIQVHPTDAQAVAGFEAEQAAGVALDSPHRNYKDSFSKPETVIALSEMKILTGVRPADELAQLAQGLELDWLKPLLGAASARELLAAIIHMDDDAAAAAVAQTVARASSWAAAHPSETSALDTLLARAADLVAQVDRKHPGDRGLLVAVVMNLVYLAPGDSAFTPDGQVHAYVSGTAIEIMNPSDNVMRAGLTPKHIDTEELIKILGEQQAAPKILRSEPDDAPVSVYRLWDERMSVIRVRLNNDSVALTLSGVAAVLGVSGSLTFTSAETSIAIEPTESLLHTGSDTEVEISGSGEAYIAAYV